MIKNLRIKLILASMLSLFIVLSIILGTVGILNYRQLLSDADKMCIRDRSQGLSPLRLSPALQIRRLTLALRFFRFSASSLQSLLSAISLISYLTYGRITIKETFAGLSLWHLFSAFFFHTVQNTFSALRILLVRLSPGLLSLTINFPAIFPNASKPSRTRCYRQSFSRVSV